jgi:hypothetical protein
MAFEKRDMTGSFQKNDRKDKDSQPDYRGSVKVKGTDYWLSGWDKQGPSGPFVSVALKEKDGTTARPASNDETKAYIESQKNKPHATQPALDDEIPF